MSFHTYMETFAEAFVAAHTQTPHSLQMPPTDPRPLRPAELEQHELPTMLNKDQLGSGEHFHHCSDLSNSPPTGQHHPANHHPVNLTYSNPRLHKFPIVPRQQTIITSSPSHSLTSHSLTSQVDTKTVAVHCIIEPPLLCKTSGHGAEDVMGKLDTYVVLPGVTPFKEVIHSVLLKLGYSHGDVMGARGVILIKEWQPLTFDTICRDSDATVLHVLGDLTNIATLSIQLSGYSPDEDNVEWSDHTVRCAVNELLKEMNQCKLAKLSPLSQSTISNIANSKYLARIGVEKCKEFGIWYRAFRASFDESEDDSVLEHRGDTRLTFHPSFELPKMRSWYTACKTPSDQVLRRFLDEINAGHVRQQRPKVTLTKLRIWWKNEKQREKRLQLKQDRACSELQQDRGCSELQTVNGPVGENNDKTLIEGEHGTLRCLDGQYHISHSQGQQSENPNMNDMHRDPMLCHP